MSESKTPIEPIETLVERDLSGWAKFIWNCADGSNYFRYSEYCDLIWTLDRYASDLAVALAERDAAKAELKSLLEEPFFREHQHALHRAMVAEAERDALAARVEKAEARVRVLPEPVGYISTGTYYWLVRGKANPASIYGTGSIAARKTDKYDNPVYMEPNDDALSREEKS